MGSLGILSVFCLLMFFSANALIPITDPVESNYALTAKEMIASGDYFSPRIYGNYWYDKPILFYWELIAAFQLMGIHEFAARFFPALMASAGVFLTYFFGKKLYDRQTGFVAAVILGTSLEYWYLAHAVITDMTLFVAVSAVLICFYLGYSNERPVYYYGSYAWAAVAVLTKGPIGICLPGLIVFLFLLWQRDLRHFLKLRLCSGMLLFIAVVSLWYYPMYQKHGWDFINTFFGVHNVLRVSVSEHPEVDVWYYYLAVFLAGFIPWVFAVLPATIRSYWKKRELPFLDGKRKFLFVWAVTVPVVFQCFATKYITYTLPYMMPVAILFALYFREHGKLFRRFAIFAVVGLNLCMFLVAIPLCQKNSEKDTAHFLSSVVDDKTILVSYGSRYPTSLVFYSGHEIFRTDLRELVHHMRPTKMNWTSTNVMPFLPIEDLPSDKRILALVYKKKEEQFFEWIEASEWTRLKESGAFYIYERKPLRDAEPPAVEGDGSR